MSKSAEKIRSKQAESFPLLKKRLEAKNIHREAKKNNFQMHKKHIESVPNLHQKVTAFYPPPQSPGEVRFPRPPGRGIGANWNSKVMTSCRPTSPGHGREKHRGVCPWEFLLGVFRK